MTLLERNVLLGQLEGHLESVLAGAGRVVALFGEAGVGKSMLAQALATRSRNRVRVLRGACEDLSTPQPLGPLHDLIRREGGPLPEEGMTQLALFSALLERFTSEPTLVVLEDLHWADDATLDLVRFIGRRIQDAPLMLLITARNDALGEQARLRRALVNMAPGVGARFEVPRLSQAAVHALARDHGQDGERVFALTGGNAFLTMEVVSSGEDCPVTVRDAMLARAERLSPSARTALDAASIFPRQVESWLLEAVCETSEGLAECVDMGMLSHEEERYAFRHEIARRTIEGALPLVARVRLNKKALEALRERGPQQTARLVHHAIAAGDGEAVCELAPRAAAEAARIGAHRQAAQYYAASLAHAHILDPSRRAELLEQSAFELQLIGRVPDSIEAFKGAVALRRQAGDLKAVGDGLRWLSRLHYNNGDRANAALCLKQAIETLEPLEPGPELAMAWASVALLDSLDEDFASASGPVGRALDLAKQLGRDDIAGDVHSAFAMAKQWVDRPAARADLEESLALALAQNREESAARNLAYLVVLETNARETGRARNAVVRALDYCAGRDLELWSALIRGRQAELLVREGQWEAAEAIASDVVDTAVLAPLIRGPAMAALARLRIRSGTGGVEELLEGLNVGQATQRAQLMFASILAEQTWVAGDAPDAALRALADAAPIAARIGDDWSAGEIAYRSWKLGEPLAPPEHVAEPYRLLFAGDWRAAANAWVEAECVFEQALALLEGDDRGCAEGLAILDGLGARATAERVRIDLRRRGVRSIARGPRAATRANAAGLTLRQMDVLKLIDRGLANAEIAEKLGVAVKTVDHHVSAVLEKLGASTRGEAAARARESGLIGSNGENGTAASH